MESKVFEIISKERMRQAQTIELIASENFTSAAVQRAVGSCMMNKYSEGYPHARYYGGCAYVDELEEYCQTMWRKAFSTDYHVNVQPHSGTSANLAAYLSVLAPGDVILSMGLSSGGHLSHGHPVNLSGKIYRIVSYGLDERGYLDMARVRALAREHHPKLIVAGASAYSRIIDYAEFAAIAHEVGAYLLVDMAHIAGLIVSGDHPSPFGLADLITTTTHKTLRGSRGGLIFAKPELARKVDSAIFPGAQGGPLQHEIAGKAVTAEEACTPDFVEYGHRIVRNARAMCAEFVRLGYDVVTGGTDNHLFLIDLSAMALSGKAVQEEMERHGIAINKNCVPNDPLPPTQTSGIRIGTPAMTTRGYREDDFIAVARRMDAIMRAMPRG